LWLLTRVDRTATQPHRPHPPHPAPAWLRSTAPPRVSRPFAPGASCPPQRPPPPPTAPQGRFPPPPSSPPSLLCSNFRPEILVAPPFSLDQWTLSPPLWLIFLRHPPARMRFSLTHHFCPQRIRMWICTNRSPPLCPFNIFNKFVPPKPVHPRIGLKSKILEDLPRFDIREFRNHLKLPSLHSSPTGSFCS